MKTVLVLAKKYINNNRHTGMLLAGIHNLEWFLAISYYLLVDGFWPSPE